MKGQRQERAWERHGAWRRAAEQSSGPTESCLFLQLYLDHYSPAICMKLKIVAVYFFKRSCFLKVSLAEFYVILSNSAVVRAATQTGRTQTQGPWGAVDARGAGVPPGMLSAHTPSPPGWPFAWECNFTHRKEFLSPE